MEPGICLTWSDHRWTGPKFLESGRHSNMGSYNRYVDTCEMCGRTRIETEWISLSKAALSGGYGIALGETKPAR